MPQIDNNEIDLFKNFLIRKIQQFVEVKIIKLGMLKIDFNQLDQLVIFNLSTNNSVLLINLMGLTFNTNQL